MRATHTINLLGFWCIAAVDLIWVLVWLSWIDRSGGFQHYVGKLWVENPLGLIGSIFIVTAWLGFVGTVAFEVIRTMTRRK